MVKSEGKCICFPSGQGDFEGEGEIPQNVKLYFHKSWILQRVRRECNILGLTITIIENVHNLKEFQKAKVYKGNYNKNSPSTTVNYQYYLL